MAVTLKAEQSRRKGYLSRVMQIRPSGLLDKVVIELWMIGEEETEGGDKQSEVCNSKFLQYTNELRPSREVILPITI